MVEAAEAVEVGVVKTEVTVEEAEMGVAEVLVTLTTHHHQVVICTGNSGKEPGDVETVTPVLGETSKAPSRDTTETSLLRLKWKW